MEIPFWLDAYRPSWNLFRLSFYCASGASSRQSQNMQVKAALVCCAAQQKNDSKHDISGICCRLATSRWFRCRVGAFKALLTALNYACGMSRIDVIAKTESAGDEFAANHDRLVAVDSVIALVADMARIEESVSLNLPDRALLQNAYDTGSPMVRKRFDRICIDLAIIARSGVQALLQLKSDGRQNFQIAAARLLRDLQTTSAQMSLLLRH